MTEKNSELRFVAMEYWGLFLNRTFVIFVNKERVLGLKVKGIVGASPVYLLKKYQDPNTFITTRSRKKYSNLENVSDDAVLELDWHNFIIQANEINEIIQTTDKKANMGTVPHSGRIFITDKNGKKREFILLGTQDVLTIFQNLKKILGCSKYG